MKRYMLGLVFGMASVGCEVADAPAKATDSGDDLVGVDSGDTGLSRLSCSGLGAVVHVTQGGTLEDAYAVQAARALGFDVVATDRDADLVAALQTQTPAVLVIDSVVSRPDDEDVLPLVAAYLDNGGAALIGLSDLHRNTPWNTVLGVEAEDQWDSRPMAAAEGAPVNLFAASEDIPEGLRNGSSVWAIDGHTLSADGGVPLAVFSDGGETAVMSLRDGRLLVNGWFGDVLDRVDNDADGVPDAQELFANELQWVGGCSGE